MNEEKMLGEWAAELRISPHKVTPEQNHLIGEYVREFGKKGTPQIEAYTALLGWAIRCQEDGKDWDALLSFRLMIKRGSDLQNHKLLKALLCGDPEIEIERDRFSGDPGMIGVLPGGPDFWQLATIYTSVRICPPDMMDRETY